MEEVLNYDSQEVDTDFMTPAVALIRGIVYRADAPAVWEKLNDRLSELQDYFAKIGLEIYLDDEAGYAYLRQMEGDFPRLARKQTLGFKVSFLLALLRGELARCEEESVGDVVIGAEEIAERFALYLPDTHDEARLQKEIDTAIAKAVELGFLKKLKDGGYKIQPVLKSFVDAQWLADFDEKLEGYIEKLKNEE